MKTVLFDFDGTIADTLSACIQIANQNAKAWGFREVNNDEIERLKGMTPFELLKEFKIPFYKVPFLLKKVQLELFEGMDSIKPFSGMVELFHQLDKEGFSLGIITSNSEENVKRFLHANDIHVFDYIHSEKNMFGKSNAILNFIKRYKLSSTDVVYVGDEVRDIDAAHKSGITCISVSWGFNTKELLQKHNSMVVDSPAELLQKIKAQTQ